MASLIEELLVTLEKECVEYEKLLELSEKKTPIIIKNDVGALENLTDEEQIVVNQISHLDSKREAVTKDIANVINKDVETLKLSVLAELLASQKVEQKRLIEASDRLKTVVEKIRRVNEQNQYLITHALEMIEFDLNLVRSMKQAPQTANYGRSAINTGGRLGSSRGFDAKQ